MKRKQDLKNVVVPRHFWGALISGVLGIGSSIISSNKAKKEAERQEKLMFENQMRERALNDKIESEQNQSNGFDLASYYFAGGGMLPFDTMGGQLNPIAGNVQEVEGNTHFEDDIDNTSGVKLFNKNEQMPFAEVEDDEVLANGGMVFSNRLKADKNKTYAKKAKELGNKISKEEEKANSKTANKRTLDTANRNLVGLNNQLNQLFLDQESKKVVKEPQLQEIIPNQPQTPFNTFAKGGYLGDPPVKKYKSKSTPYEGYEDVTIPAKKGREFTKEELDALAHQFYTAGDAGGYYKDAENDLHYVNDKFIKKVKDYANKQSFLDRIYYAMPNIFGNEGAARLPKNSLLNRWDGEQEYYDTPSRVENRAVTKTLKRDFKTKQQVKSLQKIMNKKTPERFLRKDFNTVKKFDEGGWTGQDFVNSFLSEETAKSSTNEIITGAIPYVDNIVNSLLTLNTPKVAKPLLNKPKSLETTVNINPQLQNLRDTINSNNKAILDNTSDSNVARNNIVANKLAGVRNLNEMLVRKEETERSLRNANIQNIAQTESINNQMRNNYNRENTARANAIQGKISQNIAQGVDDFLRSRDFKAKEAYQEKVLDLEGQKYKNSGVVLRSDLNDEDRINTWRTNPELRKRAAQRYLERRADGTYRFPREVSEFLRLFPEEDAYSNIYPYSRREEQYSDIPLTNPVNSVNSTINTAQNFVNPYNFPKFNPLSFRH